MIFKKTDIDENGQEYVVMAKNSDGHLVQVLFARNFQKLADGSAKIEIPLVQLHSDQTYLPLFIYGNPPSEETLIKAQIIGEYYKVPVRG